jgi:ADP-ribosylglycohydrolase
VTGAILGAYVGANALPESWKNIVLKTNKEIVGIDLITLANRITAQAYPQ